MSLNSKSCGNHQILPLSSTSVWLTLLAILQPIACFGTPSGVWIEREVRVMGTNLVLRLEAADRRLAEQAAEAAILAVERADDLLSTWRRDAELARVNQTPCGNEAVLSPHLLALLREAGQLRAMTGGAFDPAVGSLVDAWDLRGTGAVPNADRLRTARAAAGWERFRLSAAGITKLHAAAWLDAGAFAKGAALRAARAAVESEGARRALLNFGGQILAVSPPGATPWRIGIADPGARAHSVAALVLRNGSVATSGQSEQTLAVRGRRVGHILDPRSGEPVPAWGSVTVVDPDPLRADALATALFVLGPAQGWAWAETHDVAALFVSRDASGPSLRPTAALASGRMGAVLERTKQ